VLPRHALGRLAFLPFSALPLLDAQPGTKMAVAGIDHAPGVANRRAPLLHKKVGAEAERRSVAMCAANTLRTVQFKTGLIKLSVTMLKMIAIFTQELVMF